MSASGQWVVTDPASYTYYIEQLRQLTSQLETARNQLDSIKQVQRDLTGMYNRARGLVEDLKRVEEEYRDIEGIIARGGPSVGIPSIGGFEDIQKVINKTFEDSRTRSSTKGGMAGADARHQVQQEALKGVIGNSERLLSGIADRMAKLRELAAQIDGTANVKDAMDLNNRISVETLRVLIDMLAVAAQNNQAQSLFNYSGVTDAGKQERQRVLNDTSKAMTSVEDALRQYARGKPVGQAGNYARQVWGIDISR